MVSFIFMLSIFIRTKTDSNLAEVQSANTLVQRWSTSKTAYIQFTILYNCYKNTLILQMNKNRKKLSSSWVVPVHKTGRSHQVNLHFYHSTLIVEPEQLSSSWFQVPKTDISVWTKNQQNNKSQGTLFAVCSNLSCRNILLPWEKRESVLEKKKARGRGNHVICMSSWGWTKNIFKLHTFL